MWCDHHDSYRYSTIKVILIVSDNKHAFLKVHASPQFFSAAENRRYRSQFNKANNNSHNDAINAHGCCKNALTVYRSEKPLRAVCDIKKKGPRTPIADATTASVMATKLYFPFFLQPVGVRASAIIRLVGTFDLWAHRTHDTSVAHAEKREAPWCRGAAKRQAGLSCIWSVSLY